ncbi:BrnA antitoxin family protein [Streptomyces flavidovirens]|uniref:BrnA antitoxin family protein n=1 Tax=Streptomyces flavidovirens TaxID=67298 RepID=A0ABW6RHY5_9ACTN|nr:BrnA antitoxin family protein [Streptomyces sp. ISL-99]
MATRMLSVRIDSDSLESIKERAAARDMTVQEYVVTTLQRDEFVERFKAAFRETMELYGDVLAEADAADRVEAAAQHTDDADTDAPPSTESVAA